MIEIIVNLVPYGLQGLKRQIAGMRIWNDATGNREVGNYGYELMDEEGEVTLRGKFKGFERRRGVQYLVKEILDDAL